MSCMWSPAAFAADTADDILRAAITAAPRFWTVCNGPAQKYIAIIQYSIPFLKYYQFSINLLLVWAAIAQSV
jgi:hypothetical protein